MLEVVDFTLSYAPADGIRSPCVIMEIASTEGLIIFVLDIFNAFKNAIYLTLQKKSILACHIYIWIGTKENCQNIH